MDDFPLVSSIIWRAGQDGEIIRPEMSDGQVWLVCRNIGGKRLADGLQRWLIKIARL